MRLFCTDDEFYQLLKELFILKNIPDGPQLPWKLMQPCALDITPDVSYGLNFTRGSFTLDVIYKCWCLRVGVIIHSLCHGAAGLREHGSIAGRRGRGQTVEPVVYFRPPLLTSPNKEGSIKSELCVHSDQSYHFFANHFSK